MVMRGDDVEVSDGDSQSDPLAPNKRFREKSSYTDHRGTAHRVSDWLRKHLLCVVFGCLCIGIVVGFLIRIPIGLTTNVGQLKSCDENWIVYNGTCYLYHDGKTWKECEKFCRDQEASLPILCDSAMKETVRRFMKSSGDHWAGLYRQNGTWVCSDGTCLHDEEFKDYPDMDCGIFNKKEISAQDCDSNKECVCVKDSPWQHPQF